jgi:hypothetical protein
MAKTDYKTIDQYHKTFSGDTVQRMQKIRDIIHKVVPDANRSFRYPAINRCLKVS